MEFAACGYMAYNKFKDDDSQKWEAKNISTVINLMCWVLIHFVQMFVVIDVSSSTVEEANKTGGALHQAVPSKIVEFFFSTQIKKYRIPQFIKFFVKVEMVSLRLLQQPVKISLHGFIELEFSLLYSVKRKIFLKKKISIY